MDMDDALEILEERRKRMRKRAEIVWILISAILILTGIFVDLPLSFIASIFFMAISYFASGISTYEWKPNPYKSMAKSPQPDEVEYKDIKKEEEMEVNSAVKKKNEFSWIMVIAGVLPLFIDFVLLIAGWG